MYYLTPWTWNQYVPPKHWYTHTRLHGIIHNKTAVRNYLGHIWNIAIYETLHSKFLTSITTVNGRVCIWRPEMGKRGSGEVKVDTKAYEGSRQYIVILNLGKRWKWDVDFRLRPPYPRTESSRYPVNWRFSNLHSRQGSSGERKHILTLPEVDPSFLDYLSRISRCTDGANAAPTVLNWYLCEDAITFTQA